MFFYYALLSWLVYDIFVWVSVKLLSRVRLFATPWTVAYQVAPPSMGFSRQEYWSGLPFPSPGNLPDPGFKPGSPAFQAYSLTSELAPMISLIYLHLIGVTQWFLINFIYNVGETTVFLLTAKETCFITFIFGLHILRSIYFSPSWRRCWIRRYLKSYLRLHSGQFQLLNRIFLLHSVKSFRMF